MWANYYCDFSVHVAFCKPPENNFNIFSLVSIEANYASIPSTAKAVKKIGDRTKLNCFINKENRTFIPSWDESPTFFGDYVSD